MNPDDFQPAGHWRQRTRGPTRDDRRPIFRINHPTDHAFYAEVTLSPPSWRWTVNGRVAMHNYGYAKRKRQAMWQAINALRATHDACQNPFIQ
jgi:hypothetical protein